MFPLDHDAGSVFTQIFLITPLNKNSVWIRGVRGKGLAPPRRSAVHGPVGCCQLALGSGAQAWVLSPPRSLLQTLCHMRRPEHTFLEISATFNILP